MNQPSAKQPPANQPPANHPPATTSVLDQITAAIGAAAPDVVDEIAGLDPDADLFEEFGLDSMDRLGIMAALSTATGVEIPERDYASLTTIRRLVAYLT